MAEPGDIEVVDERGREVVRPDVVSFIMQATATAQLVKLRKLEESKVPSGSKSIDYTVSDAGLVLRNDPPWISFSLANDGPNGVFVEVGDPSPHALDDGAVASGESYAFDAVYAVIERLDLRCSAGETAAIRIKAKVGRTPRQTSDAKQAVPLSRGQLLAGSAG